MDAGHGGEAHGFGTQMRDPETATDDDASPVCEVCGCTKVATPAGRWVCTNGPGHFQPRATRT